MKDNIIELPVAEGEDLQKAALDKLAKWIKKQPEGSILPGIMALATCLNELLSEGLVDAAKGHAWLLVHERWPSWGKRDFNKIWKEAAADVDGPEGGDHVARMLIDIGAAGGLFRTADKKAFADVQAAGHMETLQIGSTGYREWLQGAYYASTKSSVQGQSMETAISTLRARALHDADSSQNEVCVRVGEAEGRVYIDTGNDDWQVIRVSKKGWKVIEYTDCPVRFTRTSSTLPIPLPVEGGKIDDLCQLLRFNNIGDFQLYVAVLLAAIRPTGPYPVLAITGPFGAAKTTATRIFVELVDNHKAPVRNLPRSSTDLVISAMGMQVSAFDNVGRVPAALSDALCRLSTGGGEATRTLYTHTEETVLEACKPILMNGISDFINKPDLSSRTIAIELAPVPEDERLTEKEIRKRFEYLAPGIIGSLLDGVAKGLRRQGEVQVKNLPRMADFIIWVTACETAWWKEGTILEAYRTNREELAMVVLEADEVASALLEMMARDYASWEGSMTELLDCLKSYAPDDYVRSPYWPKTARALSARLRKAAPLLHERGVKVSFSRGPAPAQSKRIVLEGTGQHADRAAMTTYKAEQAQKQEGVWEGGKGP
jgi:hypothetical protein